MQPSPEVSSSINTNTKLMQKRLRRFIRQPDRLGGRKVTGKGLAAVATAAVMYTACLSAGYFLNSFLNSLIESAHAELVSDMPMTATMAARPRIRRLVTG